MDPRFFQRKKNWAERVNKIKQYYYMRSPDRNKKNVNPFDYPRQVSKENQPNRASPHVNHVKPKYDNILLVTVGRVPSASLYTPHQLVRTQARVYLMPGEARQVLQALINTTQIGLMRNIFWSIVYFPFLLDHYVDNTYI